MWELFTRISRGRVSSRRISLLATSVMMAIFLAASVPSSAVFAADAQRTGDTVTYEAKTFTKVNPQATPSQLPSGLPSTTDGYAYFDTATKKAYFLLTQGPAANSNTAEYVSYDMAAAGQYSRPSPSTTVTIVSAPAATTADATQAGTRTSCDSSQTAGVGWILCPVVNFLAKGMDYIYKVVSNFLVVRTVTADTNGSIYRMWSIVRDIANLCFVAAFLVIIYSQITGLGYSNYNLKKMLPRLVIGAILVNISFWVAAFAVDISNIVGYSIHDMFTNVMKNLNTASAYGGAETPSWEAAALFVLGGTAAGGAIAIGGYAIAASSAAGALFLLAPTLVGVILAALVALVVLAARQALIVCLIIISPLAFAAMLLPNTEKYFDKWRSIFMTMLLLFPIFAAIFSGAQLAGMAIMQTADGNIVTIILGMAVQVAPIVVTPLLIKFSGGLIGRIAGMINNPNKGLIDRTRKWSKDMADERRNRALTGRPNPDGTFTPLRRHAATRTIDRRRRGRDARRKNYETGAENTYASSELGMRLERQARDLGVNKKNIETDVLSGREGHRIRTRETDAETRKKREDATYERTTQAQHAKFRSQMADVRMSEAENIFNNSSMGHRIDSAKRTVDQTKQTIAAQHDLNWNNALVNNPTLRGAEVNLRSVKGAAEVQGQRVSNMFDDSAQGHHLDRTKREVETVKARIEADHKAHWDELSRTDSSVRNLRLEVAHSTDNAKLQEEQFNTVVANIRAQGGAAPGLSAADAALADGILRISRETRVEAEKQSNAKIEQDKGYLETLSRDETTRLAAGGIRGAEGAKTVFAKTVAASRKEYIDRINETAQLMKHFNPSSNEKQVVAMGGSVTVEKDGVSYTFDASDDTAREAFIEEQLKAGSAQQIQDIVNTSGRGEVNNEYRTSIRDAVIANGLANRFFFWGAKTLDDMGQGNYSKAAEADAITYHVRDGKLSGEKLLSQDASAIDALIKVVDNPAAMAAMSPDQRGAFDTNYQHLKHEAWRVIHDPQLKARASAATIERLEAYMEEPPTT